MLSSFVTGSNLKNEKSTLQLVGISRRIRWLHDVAVKWSSTSHLSQKEDRLCSRSVNRTLVKMWHLCATPENRARRGWEKIAVLPRFSRDSLVDPKKPSTPEENHATGIFHARANNALRVNQFGCLTSCLQFHWLQWWLLVPAGHPCLIVWQLVILRLWLLCKLYLIFLFSIDFARQWLWRQMS